MPNRGNHPFAAQSLRDNVLYGDFVGIGGESRIVLIQFAMLHKFAKGARRRNLRQVTVVSEELGGDCRGKRKKIKGAVNYLFRERLQRVDIPQGSELVVVGPRSINAHRLEQRHKFSRALH